MRAPGPEFLEFEPRAVGARAREFLAALGARVGRPAAAGPAPDRLIVVVDNLDALPPADGRKLDRRRPERDRTGLHRSCWLSIPAGSRPRSADPREARRRLGKWLQVTVNLPARKDADGELVVARLLSAGARARACAGSGDRRGARGAAVELRKRRCLRRSRPSPPIRRATPSASSTPIAWRAARSSPRAGDGAHAGRGLRRRRRAGGDARAARQWIGRTDRHRRSARAWSKPIKAARAANNGPISIEDARAAAETPAATPCRSEPLSSRSAQARARHRRGAGAQVIAAPQASSATCRNCPGK